MMKLLVYTDGRPSSERALHFAARLAKPLNAELAVMTVRSGTHAIEPAPPFGQPVDLTENDTLPPGLQTLAHARQVLAKDGIIDHQENVRLRELPNGHLFVHRTADDRRIPFYVCFGHMIEILNHEIDKQRYDLLIIAPPPRGRLRKMLLGDTNKKLIIDLHTSILIVRGGRAESRYIVCADGSAAAKRQFPMLKRLLPAISPPLEFICVQTPDADDAAVQQADQCIAQAEQWLGSCGKPMKLHRLKGEHPAQIIAETAGTEAVIVVGASLRHDVYRRLRGSLPIRILSKTAASTLVVKSLPEDSPEDHRGADACQRPEA